MFAYDVYSEEQADKLRFSLLQPGQYDAKIKACAASSSNTGNNMFDMVLDVFDKDGAVFNVRTFLPFTAKMAWKVRHAARSAGLLDAYNNNLLTDKMMSGRKVNVMIDIEHGKEISPEKLDGRPAGTKYPDKNIVVDFLECVEAAPAIENVPFNDYVPF